MKIELRKLSDIKPYPGNPRINDSAVDAVAKSQCQIGSVETWAVVPGYENLYEVSSCGRLRRKSKSKMAPAGYVLKPRLTWDGYLRFSLSKGCRYWHVKAHRLVALAFLGSPPFAGAQVAHTDGNKLNNHSSNLRWVTPAENEADKRRHGRVRGAWPGEQHHNAKLTTAIVAELRRRVASGLYFEVAARQLGVASMTAYDAIFGKTWKTVVDPPPVPRAWSQTSWK